MHRLCQDLHKHRDALRGAIELPKGPAVLPEGAGDIGAHHRGDNVNVALTYYNLSILYTKMGLLPQAGSYAERTFGIWMRVYK